MPETLVSRPELVTVIGKDAADVLCRTYGGVPVYVPQKVDPSGLLCRFIGVTAMKALCLEYGGLRITVPNGRKAEPFKGDIMRRLDEGRPHQAIALELGVTERYVRQLASNLNKGPRQLSLFGV